MTPEQLASAHPLLRDLIWTISSPSLLKSSSNLPMASNELWAEQNLAAEPLFQELLKDPTPLIKALPPKRSSKIGLIFEDLLAFWFSHHPSWSLLAHDEQIFNGRETAGALDFLIDTSSAIVHLEVAVKFYLCRNDSSAWSDWVGPSLRDNLERKLLRIRDHQLPLAQTEATHRHCRFKKLPPPQTSLAVIKGIFFGHWGSPLVAPYFGKVPTGIWLFADELDSYLGERPEHRWAERRRPHWLAPLISSAAIGLSAAQLKEELILRPRMFSALHKVDQLWRERERIFLLPDHWEMQ